MVTKKEKFVSNTESYTLTLEKKTKVLLPVWYNRISP